MDERTKASLKRVLMAAEGDLTEPSPYLSRAEDNDRVKAMLKDCNNVRKLLGMQLLRIEDYVKN